MAFDPPESSDGLAVWAILGNAEPKSLDGATFVPQEDGSFLVTGKNPRDDRWVVKAEVSLPGIRAIRIEALTDKSMKRNGPGRASNGNLALSDIRVFAKKIGEEGEGQAGQVDQPAGRSSAKYDQSFHRFLH